MNQPDAEQTKNQLTAILEQYKSLRTEIQYRSEFQARYQQFHLATLTVLIGAALTRYGEWLVLLIPIEASIFGLWYLDSAISIDRIARYIETVVESNVGKVIACQQFFEYERQYTNRPKVLIPGRSTLSFITILGLTFGGPCLLAILVAAVLILVSFIPWSSPLLDIQAPYTGPMRPLALGIFMADIILSLTYYGATRRLSKIRRFRAEEQRIRFAKEEKLKSKPTFTFNIYQRTNNAGSPRVIAKPPKRGTETDRQNLEPARHD